MGGYSEFSDDRLVNIIRKPRNERIKDIKLPLILYRKGILIPCTILL